MIGSGGGGLPPASMVLTQGYGFINHLDNQSKEEYPVFYNRPTVGLLKNGSRTMPRIVKEPLERRNEILDATQQLIISKGYERMTIQDVIDRLQISKGASGGSGGGVPASAFADAGASGAFSDRRSGRSAGATAAVV